MLPLQLTPIFGAGGETRTHDGINPTDYKSVPIAAMGHQHLFYSLLISNLIHFYLEEVKFSQALFQLSYTGNKIFNNTLIFTPWWTHATIDRVRSNLRWLSIDVLLMPLTSDTLYPFKRQYKKDAMPF